MTPTDFIAQCESTMGNGKVKLMPAQQSVYLEKLRPFSQDQLSAIYHKVLELTEHFPKVKNIYDAARELGYLQTESEHFRPHRWNPTDCRMCKGEGRLCVTWIVTTEIRNDEKREAHALSQIVAYSDSCSPDNFQMQDGEYRSLFRCSCLAGDADGIPKGWPRWSKSMPAVRYVQ